jgi:hypothetical protein
MANPVVCHNIKINKLCNLSKHEKYENSYKPNELFWGLGIENETYLESKHVLKVTNKELQEKRKPERYSVNYYSVYKPEILDTLFDLLPADVSLPLLINAHSFQLVDLKGNHKTLYQSLPKPNPIFTGETLLDYLIKTNPEYFKKEYEKSYIFDGDTIEFMTQDFYNATIDKVIKEIKHIEYTFEKELNITLQDVSNTWFGINGPLKITHNNWPFASYLTNMNNYAMFNNGTIHINITLPTMLNSIGRPLDMIDFIAKHKIFIRIIQWIEPFFVALYGSPDPWSSISDRFAKGSQRLAVSRYISIGTYDTDKMQRGKILTVNKKDLVCKDWMDEFYSKTDYVPLSEVGLDINFNKHYSHGIELRIFDGLLFDDIEKIIKVLVGLADHSLSFNIFDDPRKSTIWHKLVVKCLLKGKEAIITYDEQVLLKKLFGLSYNISKDLPVTDVYNGISEWLSEQYKDGLCANCFIKGIQPDKKISLEKSINNQLSVEVASLSSKRFWCC